jgi:methyl-accepting chemotaxis protein
MSAELPSGRGFFQRVVLWSYVYSIGALLLVLPALHAVLELTRAQWWWFLAGGGIYTLLIIPPQTLLQRRIFGRLPEWLDARARGDVAAELTRAAFADAIDLPRRSAWMGLAGWAVPVVLLAIAMELRWPTWTYFETVSVLVCGLAAGFVAAVFLLFIVKRECEGVRMALARELGDPELRQSLAHPLSMRVKLGVSVTALAVVPAVFAGLIFHVMAVRSLERFTTSWQAGVLDARGVSLDAPGPSADAASPSLTEQLEISVLDLDDPDASGLEPHVLQELRSDVAKGMQRGDSLGIPSQRVFAWRRQADGSLLLAALPAETLRVDRTPMWTTLALLMVASGGVALGLALLLSSDVSRATDWLRMEAERLAAGDLRGGRVYESEDELGALGRSFAGMSRSLRDLVSRVAAAADRVDGTAASMAEVTTSVGAVTTDQVAAIRQTASSMDAVNQQVRGIADSAQALNVSVEESSSSILELGAAGEELNDTASALSERVNEVSSSIEQMVRSVRQVLENTESLSEAAVETSASMGEMATSMREVDSAAEETARLSRQVVDSADSGQAKMVQTIEGMDAIREATETAERVIRSLGGRASEIGAIVDVIDDVADETNLLALNAAIIAAQAGEHGRAFSVVADEIKDLADRVLASTKEIGSLIRAVQDESNNAIGAIEKGSRSVASGVDMAAEAGMSLEEITRASRDSGQRIAGIVQAVREQARAASHVVELMERVRNGVEEIRSASSEQDRGNEVVYRGALAMREVAQQVRGTTEEQARGSGRIRESIEGVREAVEQIGEALREQSAACRSAVELLEAMDQRTRSNQGSAERMDEVTRDLVAQAEDLRRDVRRFQLA